MPEDYAPGNFTGLAANYSLYRPGYSEHAVKILRALVGTTQPLAADVGAGTGIWSRMLANGGFEQVQSVEPNDDMRAFGVEDSKDFNNITWHKGTGANTGLSNNMLDLVTMASSFHWVGATDGLPEFKRILKTGGWFCALWNPRKLVDSPLLMEIEAKLTQLKPDLNRVSSGSAKKADELAQEMASHPAFDSPIYFEAEHTEYQTPEHYLGVWNSVNDVRSQLGENKWSQFIDFVTDKISGLVHIEARYTTRLWAVKKRG